MGQTGHKILIVLSATRAHKSMEIMVMIVLVGLSRHAQLDTDSDANINQNFEINQF